MRATRRIRRASYCRKRARAEPRMRIAASSARRNRSRRRAASAARRVRRRTLREAPLGFAVAQLHGVYILSQTADGMVLVDMHAAHERVMYEDMKKLLGGHTAQQQLLVPEILNVTAAQADAAEAHAAEFAALGFIITRWAPDQLALRAIPSLLAGRDPAGVVRDVLSDLLETGHSRRVEESINHLLGTAGLPRGGAGAAQFERPGNECTAAADGAHRARRSMQSRPPDLGAPVALGSRPAVHARALMGARVDTAAAEPASCALVDGSDRGRQIGSGDSPGEQLAVRNRQRRLGAGVPRHGYRDRQTRSRDAQSHCAPFDRYSRPRIELFRGRVRARCDARPCRISGGAAGSRCWSAAPCCTSMRSPSGWPSCRRRTRACARKSMRRRRRRGGRRCIEELARVDPAAAARIHVNDPQRIQRALEVYRVTGEPITRLQQSRASAFAGVDVAGVRSGAARASRPPPQDRIAVSGDAGGGPVGGSERAARKRRPDRGTSVDARGRISAGMELFGRTMRFGGGQATSDCGNATTGETSVDVAEAARKAAMVRFHAS